MLVRHPSTWVEREGSQFRSTLRKGSTWSLDQRFAARSDPWFNVRILPLHEHHTKPAGNSYCPPKTTAPVLDPIGSIAFLHGKDSRPKVLVSATCVRRRASRRLSFAHLDLHSAGFLHDELVFQLVVKHANWNRTQSAVNRRKLDSPIHE